jgi:hypothetical protein
MVAASAFTNEDGVFGTTRFVKNMMGLFLLQEYQHHLLAPAGFAYSIMESFVLRYYQVFEQVNRLKATRMSALLVVNAALLT